MQRLPYALVLCVLALAAGCGGGMLGSSALSQHAKTVQSLAAEGALLAEDAVAGRTTSVYTREHAAELAKAASREAASLQKAKTDAALEPKLRRLGTLAARVASELDRLGDASRGEQRTLGRALNAAAQAGRH